MKAFAVAPTPSRVHTMRDVPRISDWMWPCSESLWDQARDYASLSLDHTHDFVGDEEMGGKRGRIIVGRFGQLWFQELCRLNEIPFKVDGTSATENDEFDLLIDGKKIDIKTASNPNLQPQVAAHLKGKADIYVFLQVCSNNTGVRVQGYLPSEEVFVSKYFVAPGEPLPGANHLKQVLPKGSYFIPETQLWSLNLFYYHMVAKKTSPSDAIRSGAFK